MTSSAIQILGAGPGGLSAAIALARGGREVHIHERYESVGKRFQGDLQGIENWSTKDNVLERLRSLGIDARFAATPFREVTMTDGRRTFHRDSPEPLFYLVKRGPFPDSLDSSLCKQAIEHGVTIHYRSHYPQSDAHIIATGPIRQSIIAADKGLVFSTTLPNMAVGIFHDDLAYLGYSYLLIAEGYGCLCTVVFKDLHRLNNCFERTVEVARRMAPIDLTNARPVGGIGGFSLNHPLKLGSSLLVGEAAGFQDLLWGFGIRTALTSGCLAAQSLLTNQEYTLLAQKEIAPFLQASVVNRCLWETVKLGARPLLPFLMKVPFSLRTNFRLLYRFSPFHRLLYPFALRYIKRQYPHSINTGKEQDG